MCAVYNGYGFGYGVQRLGYGQGYPYMASPLQGTDGSNLVYVSGYAGAQGFQMPPNTRALLLDSEDSQFFVKSTDSLGRADICTFRFNRVDFSNAKSDNNSDNCVSQHNSEHNAELESLSAKVSELDQYLCAIKPKLDELLA